MNIETDLRRMGASAPTRNFSLPDALGIRLNRAARRAEKAKRKKWKIDPAHLKELPEEMQEHFKALNNTYALGFLGSCMRVIYQPNAGKPPKFITVKDAQLRESSRIIWEAREKGPPTKIKVFDRWLEWAGRPLYEEIKFAPGVYDPTVFNMFNGWSVHPRDGDWSLLRDHIFEVICNGNPEQFSWFMTWLAHIFQYPADKGSVAVVIRGEKGTGKSIVFDIIQRVMPDYFYKVADGKRALGNFNAHYEHTLLLLMEEAFWAGDQAKESILKDLITSPTLAIERKGVDTYMAKNHMRVAMISNERWVVPAGGRERRFAVFDCGNQRRNDICYFKAMDTQMRNGGLEAMLNELLTYVPEKGWDVLFTPPVTPGLGEQVTESLRGLDAFSYDMIIGAGYECETIDGGGIYLSEDQPTLVSLRDLRIAARDYLADAFTGQKAANYNLIERKVTEWFGAKRTIILGRVNRERWVEFPPLRQIRAHVLDAKGIEIASKDDGPLADTKPRRSPSTH